MLDEAAEKALASQLRAEWGFGLGDQFGTYRHGYRVITIVGMRKDLEHPELSKVEVENYYTKKRSKILVSRLQIGRRNGYFHGRVR